MFKNIYENIENLLLRFENVDKALNDIPDFSNQKAVECHADGIE